MSVHKDPMTQFGRKIAASVTRDPTFEAMFMPGRVIPNTWGNIASQLFEQGLVEPDPAAAAEFLGIKRAELSDPTLRFTRPYEVQEFQDDFMKRRRVGYKAGRLVGARKFGEYMEAGVVAQGVEPDLDKLQKIEEEFNTLQTQTVTNHEEHQVVSVRKGVLRLQYMAEKSGLSVPLPEFTAKVLGYADEDGFTLAERATALSAVIQDEVIGKNLFLNPEGVAAADIPVGHDLHRTFAATLRYITDNKADAYAAEQWERVEHIFIAPPYYRHPLFAGTEK